MINPFKHFINQYLDFSKKDRNGIIILCILILISVFANIVFNHFEFKTAYDRFEFEQAIAEWKKSKPAEKKIAQSLFVFNPNSISEEELVSLNLPGYIKKNLMNYRKAGGKFSSSIEFRKIYGMNDSVFDAIEEYIFIPEKFITNKKVKRKSERTISGFFNPNISDYNELATFGFNRFQLNNIIEYRNKGGVFSQPNDLLKIYGVDTAFFKTIEKYIQIEKNEKPQLNEIEVTPLFVELNEADSTDFVELNGIGPVFAARILKYRDLLGGFYSKSQLLEVYNFPEETFRKIENRITIDTVFLKPIRINFAEYSELLRHPYLNKKQVETILEYKKRNGFFDNISQIQSITSMDSITFSKIRPYITCR